MTVHELQDAPAPALGEKLERFEQQFSYPLGGSASFHISHGRDYAAFFKAIGKMTLLVAEQDGAVLGTLVGVRRPLRYPDGARQEVTYLCDLKISPGPKRGRVLQMLAKHMLECWRAQGKGGGYAVVMDGTRQTPEDYSGRCGIPGFAPVCRQKVLKISVPRTPTIDAGIRTVTLGEAAAAFEHLAGPSFVPLGGSPSLRSVMEPVPLLSAHGDACGIVEDTRRGKRLFLHTGAEMMTAHLSGFACRDAESGAALLRHALWVAGEAGFPALFVCLSSPQVEALSPLLQELEVLTAPATVYASGIDVGDWRVHVSEI